jgi:hypothetical protein
MNIFILKELLFVLSYSASRQVAKMGGGGGGTKNEYRIVV